MYLVLIGDGFLHDLYELRLPCVLTIDLDMLDIPWNDVVTRLKMLELYVQYLGMTSSSFLGYSSVSSTSSFEDRLERAVYKSVQQLREHNNADAWRFFTKSHAFEHK